MWNSKKTVLVIGATGKQGGSVVKHLMLSGRYNVRGLTRNPNSGESKALIELGVSIVQGDLKDKYSLRRAMRDCYAVYGVTDYWEHSEGEYEQGINLVDATRISDVQHLVMHTLPNARRLSGGRLSVYPMDLKAGIEDYARMSQVPATFVHIANYYCNFLNIFPPKLSSDGVRCIIAPMGTGRMDGIAVEDIGGFVVEILDANERYKGISVDVIGDYLSGDEYAGILSAVTDQIYLYKNWEHGLFVGLNRSQTYDFASIYEFKTLFQRDMSSSLNVSRQIFPRVRSFKQWAYENAEKFKQSKH